jgi:hypothetical protein
MPIEINQGLRELNTSLSDGNIDDLLHYGNYGSRPIKGVPILKNKFHRYILVTSYNKSA